VSVWLGGSDPGADIKCKRAGQQLLAVWYFERCLRQLPLPLHRNATLMDEVMMKLITAHMEAATAIVEGIWLATAALGLIVDADQQLSRAESLADAAGRRAIVAMAQASRGHIRGLAAEVLVDQASRGCSVVPSAELDALSELDDTAHELELAHHVGRLGDEAISMSMAAQQSVDSVVEPEAAAALAVMASGALQAAATRLLRFPPSGVPEGECRRAATALLVRSLQCLPQPQHIGGGTAASAAHAVHTACQCAHSHLVQAEFHIDARAGIVDKHQKHQVTWHLERARTALHGTDGPDTLVLLAHIHLAHARHHFGSTAPKRLEQSLDEIVAGCRAVGGLVSTLKGDAAVEEVSKLLLQRLQAILLEFCSQRVERSVRVKELYRAVLQLRPCDIAGVPDLCDRLALNLGARKEAHGRVRNKP